MGYVKCPRCNLNYIDESEKYCKVCLVEMGKLEGERDYDLEEDEMELCPECEVNLIWPHETMCKSCMEFYEKNKTAEQSDYTEETEEEPEQDDSELMMSLEEMSYQEEEDMEQEEEN